MKQLVACDPGLGAALAHRREVQLALFPDGMGAVQ